MSTGTATTSFIEDAKSTTNSGLRGLIEVSQNTLQQGVHVCNCLTSDDQLVYESKLVPGSTIGKHLRHARDHFELLIDALNSPPPYIFSYDTRKRNTPMETSRTAACEALSTTISRLQTLLKACEESEKETGREFFTVRGQKIGLDEPVTLNAITPAMQSLQSSFGRELWFSSLHAVHHWSMIRVVAGEQNIKIDGSFGVAPSTVVHREKKSRI